MKKRSKLKAFIFPNELADKLESKAEEEKK